MSQLTRLGWPWSRAGEAWGWLLAVGAISLAIGLLAVFLPRETLVIIAVLFGVQLMVGGAFRIFGAFTLPDDTGWLRPLLAVHALVAFGVGVYLLWHPALSLVVAAIVLGAYWMIHGIVELTRLIRQAETASPRTIATGILSIVVGAIVFFAPHTSLLLLSVVLGIWLIVHGVILMVGAFQVRSKGLRARASGRPPVTS